MPMAYKSVNCTTSYCNCIVGQTYIDSLPYRFTHGAVWRMTSAAAFQVYRLDTTSTWSWSNCHVDDRVLSCQWLPSSGLKAGATEQWRFLAGNKATHRAKRMICPHRLSDGRPSIRMGFVLDSGGVGPIFLGESRSRLYPHMRAKFGRDPTAGSKSVLQVYNRICQMCAWCNKGRLIFF